MMSRERETSLSYIRARLLGWMIARVARLWLWTLRYEAEGDSIDASGVVAFLHGEQLPLLLHRPLSFPLIAPISLSRDGDLQVIVMKYFQIEAARGSTSRGALSALRELRRWMRSRRGVALIAVDGPRGPYGSVSPGAPYLARALETPYWVCKVSCSRSLRLSSWDRFLIPLPFARVLVKTTLCEPSVESTQSAFEAMR